MDKKIFDRPLTITELENRIGKSVYIKFIAESGKDKWYVVKEDWSYTWYGATWIAYDYDISKK